MIGALNQRAIIEAQTSVPDDGGGATGDWQTITTVWLKIAPISGRDVFGPDRNEQRIRHRLTMWRNPAITAGMRARINTRIFTIQAILDEGPQGALMTLLAEETP